MIDVTAIALLGIAIGGPVAVTRAILTHRYRVRQLLLEEKRLTADPGVLAAVQAENRKLEARIQTLESIVCTPEFEFDARLRAAEAMRQQQLPAANAGPAEPPQVIASAGRRP